MQVISLMGIDLAKNIFWVRGEDDLGRCLVDRKVSRAKLFELVVKSRPKTVAFEACGGAHYWGQRFQAAGIQVMMIAPQYVKPYRRGDKNDANDSWAICEAARRPNLPTVAVKTVAHQNLQLALRVREALVASRTELLNGMRGSASEYGLCFPLGPSKLVSEVRAFLSSESAEALSELKQYLEECLERLRELDGRIKRYDEKLAKFTKSDRVCKSLMEVAGVGVITAIAVRASVVNPRDFKNGRQLAAYFGLVPRQNSSGGKTRLGRLGKDGNRYVRQLLIHGGRSVVRVADRHNDPVHVWAAKKFKEKGFNKACVAVANKNARMLWAIMAKHATTQQAA